MKGYFVLLLLATCLYVNVYGGDAPDPKANSKGSGKVETGDANVADIKMSTDAVGKNVKSSSTLEASSGKDKGSTKGEAKTEVKTSRRKRREVTWI